MNAEVNAGRRRETSDTVPRGLPPERELAALVLKMDAARRVVEQNARLGTADMRLLWMLADGRARTLREIGDELCLEQSTVNRQVNAALRAGLLERIRAAEQPAALIAPTAVGRTAFETEVAAILGYFEDGLAALGERRGEFLALLRGFVDAYDERVRRATGRPG
ncbi:MarR family winged helix-turn-helix transcriptional regulator [Cumulibacter manganitolerans]|uniref:MarR family winged helix-turn-helix transcriptional regulator n=1 Tax=Cumulibacter manganitolerans TaxID=1884992 RepID=UPI001E2B91EC|nr:MarR family winged helix-turn-helix transcriptional regulator [Cumulibacter manganitolerans]